MTNLIRFLSFLIFAVFLMPLCQMCSDKEIIENTLLKNHPMHRPLERDGKDFTYEEVTTALKKFVSLKNDLTMNAYEIQAMCLKDFPESSFDFSWGFTLLFVFLLSFLVACCSLKKYKWIWILSFMNSMLIIVLFLEFYFYVDDFSQIKYGTYCLILNSLLISFFTYRERTSHNPG